MYSTRVFDLTRANGRMARFPESMLVNDFGLPVGTLWLCLDFVDISHFCPLLRSHASRHYPDSLVK